jgi:RNA polymerase sigma factor (TIGR02999 family)
MPNVTTLLRNADESPEASSQFWQSAYSTLRSIAHAHLKRRYLANALDTGTLVNESYLRMRNLGAREFPNRKRFFSYASNVMRSVIVDRLRELQADRRGGIDDPHIPLTTDVVESVPQCQEGREIHAALEALERIEPRISKVVEMRYFGGFTETEVASALDIDERTVRRDWQKARLFLRSFLTT